MPINRERLLRRFLEFVAVDTKANPDVKDYPSSPGQLELGRIAAAQLNEIGLTDVIHDQHGLILATVPPTVEKATPAVAFNAHLDTSPETSGANVKPQVIENYAGGDIRLPGDTTKTITLAENPELADLHGCTLITTDGTTLLGGDDKAGVAIIIELAAHLMEHPEIPHGPIRVLFTCDEEIGRGVMHVDLEQVAADACYTLDGPGANNIDVETFSADGATVIVRGVNIHPSIAKDRMVNAIRVAGHFLSQLPTDTLSPETTDGRAGFVHPYHIAYGRVDEVEIRVLLRDFDTAKLADHAKLLRQAAAASRRAFPGSEISVDVTKQYRNLGDGLQQNSHIVEFAEQAHRRLGRDSRRQIIRGGTDGSQLTEMGLPTPNLSSGQHNPHSPLEWACLNEMEAAVEVLVELVQVWEETP